MSEPTTDTAAPNPTTGPNAAPPRGPVGDDPDPAARFGEDRVGRRRSVRRLLHLTGPGASGCAGASCSPSRSASLTLSAFLAVTTYGLVRSNLIEQRYAASRVLRDQPRPVRAARAARRSGDVGGGHRAAAAARRAAPGHQLQGRVVGRHRPLQSRRPSPSSLRARVVDEGVRRRA